MDAKRMQVSIGPRWWLCVAFMLATLAGNAWADPVQVWVQPNGKIPATAYALQGEPRDYFGRAECNACGALEYKWDFSDGTSTAFAGVGNARYIDYAGKSFATFGTHWAKLTVREAANTANTASAQVDLEVIAATSDTLNRQKNSAIDRGLRYMYQQEQTTASGAYFSGSNSCGNASISLDGYGGATSTFDSYIYSGDLTQLGCSGTFTIDWGDGAIEAVPTDDTYCPYNPTDGYATVGYDGNYPQHTYTSSGPYTVSTSFNDGVHAPVSVCSTSISPVVAAPSAASSWPGSGATIGSTGMALVAFENHGHNLQSPDSDIYKTSVQRGIQYLLDNATKEALGTQPCIGDPEANDGDLNADGMGVRIGDDNMYTTSIAVLALVNSADKAYAQSHYAATGNALNGMSFFDIAVDAKDWLAWAQVDSDGSCPATSTANGGWRYIANSYDSDNSVTQWPVLALSEAKNRWDIGVNPLVISELNKWLAYSQCGDGSFGYESPTNWCNFPKAAAGLIMLHYGGKTLADVPVTSVLSYLDSNWNTSGGDGNFNNHYSMYGLYKAMKVWEKTTLGSHNWEQEYDQNLITRQNSNGTWDDQGGWMDQAFSTYAAVAILAPAVAGLPPVANAGGPYPAISAGQDLTLDGSGSYHQDPAKNIVGYQWDFDASNGLWWDTKPAPDNDAEGKNGVGPTVSYPDIGHNQAYTVTLRVKDDTTPPEFATATATVNVTTGNVPPVPLTNGPWTALPGTEIVFDASASYDPNDPAHCSGSSCLGDSIALYEWDLDGDGNFNEANGDDGTPVTADRRIVKKSYPAPISLPAILRVTDSKGPLTATSTNTLNVVSIALVYGQQYETCFRDPIDRFRDRLGLSIKFKNQGNAEAEQVKMTLASTPSNLTIKKGVANLGTMAAGAEKVTACNPATKTADIEVEFNRRNVPTGGWSWNAEFELGGVHYTVSGIPPLGP